MVNRSCDFCHNSYKRSPQLGFFSVTSVIRDAMGIMEASCRDYICSEHFTSDCFDEKGRLLAGALPTFFPQQDCVDHDHCYAGQGDPEEDEGGEGFKITQMT